MSTPLDHCPLNPWCDLPNGHTSACGGSQSNSDLTQDEFNDFVLETFQQMLKDFKLLVETVTIIEARLTSQGKRLELLEDEFQSHTHLADGS